MNDKLVLIGNGMAGIRALEELLKLKGKQYDITVFGAEPHPNYNRIMLSPVLAGEKQFDEIISNPLSWYEENNIDLITGDPVVKIDRIKREVISQSGKVADYNRLLIATGSKPFIIPIPGAELNGVVGFRDIHDVNAMLDAAKTGKRAVVIGGGLLGLEAANGLMKQGMDVSVVHLMDTLMERQLDKPAAGLLQAELESKGLHFLLEKQSSAILGEDKVEALQFSDGSSIETDLVVMAVGIRAEIELAQQAGIYCERGIVVNDTLQTHDPRIYAVGECVQHRNMGYGLVAPLFEQAKVCANHLAEFGIARYEGSVTSTKLKVTGVDLFSAGDFLGNEDSESIVFRDPSAGVYKKLNLQEDKIVGAVLYGDTLDSAWYFQLMREGTDISAYRDKLLFGQAHIGDSGHGVVSSIANMSDDTEICGCNGVCKGDIVKAIHEKKLFTLDEVRSHTKASGSCGSCTGLVESVMAHVLGGDYSQTPSKKPLCTCTEHSHDEVIQAIKTVPLKSMDTLFKQLAWQTPNGCHVCRPALNYYLMANWPTDYQDDPQSRFINERAHGNIQKDGTYSVVPRMWGGLTNPKELRAIADVAEKFDVPEVKVTGGQRIDLFGVKKEDLPAMWQDLYAAGFVSGHAYGKAMRTVKTCVGKNWCRFGTQDSTGLGVKLEQLTWGSWMPHKFKLAVSGCPRNCAEATIKDFGVVCVDAGFELHIGGNGGVKVRVTDLLCKVKTEEEVLEYCAAFVQLYREQARYLERTAPWVERAGLSYIKDTLADDTVRQTLAQRFDVSQENTERDPWQPRAEGSQAHEFTPLSGE